MLKTDGKGLAVEGRSTQKANGLYEDKGDNGLCQCDSRSDAKQLDSGYILKIVPKEFLDTLNTVYDRKESVMTLKILD